jgi:phosphoribosylamine--glycine ligase
MKSDLVDLCYKATEGRLAGEKAEYDEKAAVGVVLAAENYPASPKKGDVISGLDASFEPDVKVFHAGTAMKDGNIVTNGGRVLCVTALGNTVLEAKQKAYRAINNISWNGMFHRNDIADRAIAREQNK